MDQKREKNNPPVRRTALDGAVAPLNQTLAQHLNEAARRNEDLTIVMEAGETTLKVAYTPPRNGRRKKLSLELEG